MSQHCTDTTAAGKPCRARAVRGSDPPRCAFHSGRARGGAFPGNQNARRHGFYAQALDPQELADLVACADDLDLDDEIAMARVVLRRLLLLLESPPAETADPTDPAAFTIVAGLALQATRTISRLLRDKRALSGAAADGIAGAIAQALDELSTEWGVEL